MLSNTVTPTQHRFGESALSIRANSSDPLHHVFTANWDAMQTPITREARHENG